MTPTSLKKIVVGTDGSGAALEAVTWAGELAAAADADVVVISVVDPMEAMRDASARVELATEGLADVWTAPLRDHGLSYDAYELEGEVRHELLAAAAREGADALVVGTRGAGGFQGLGLGGVAHHLARHATCPLIAVPRRGGKLQGGMLVAGADGSPANAPALAWTAHVAALLHARAVGAFVYRPQADVMTHTASNWTYPGENEARATVGEAGRSGTDLTFVVAAGHPVEALEHIADEYDAGAIVVGRRGRGGLHGLALGRVPAQLLHHARRPVVIIPH